MTEITPTEMLDITEPELVEIDIRSDGTVIWVNIDGICRLRVCRVTQLILNDNRTIVWGEPVKEK